MGSKDQRKLTEYVHDLMDKGYDIKIIEESLYRRGFPKKIVETTIRRVKRKYDPDKFGWHQQVFLFFYAVGMILMMIWLAFSTLSPVSSVFLTLLPTFLTLVFVYLLFNISKERYKYMVWVLPLLLSMTFYLISSAKAVPVLNKVDAANLAVFNFVLSMIPIIILDIFRNIEKALSYIPKDEIVNKVVKHKAYSQKKDLVKQRIVVHATPKNIEKYIQSIEDKSKALNSVIGRIYSVRHRGNESIRNKIKIKSELYNEFSGIDDTDTRAKLEKARSLVLKILESLKLLEKKESEVFGVTASKRLINLKRDPDGNDKIIDVLIANDKDPVETYYKGALEFCNKALAEIDHLRKS